MSLVASAPCTRPPTFLCDLLQMTNTLVPLTAISHYIQYTAIVLHKRPKTPNPKIIRRSKLIRPRYLPDSYELKIRTLIVVLNTLKSAMLEANLALTLTNYSFDAHRTTALYRSWHRHRYDDASACCHGIHQKYNIPVIAESSIWFDVRYSFFVAAEFNRIINKCQACARNTLTYRQKRKLQLFPAAGALDFIPMNIVGPFSKARQGQLYVFLVIELYPKRTPAVPTSKTIYAHMSTFFFDHSSVWSGITSYLLTDSDAQFTSPFFVTICPLLSVKHLTTTAYNHQTSSQAKRYKKMILTRLRQYVADDQKDWDSFVQPLTRA